jgi:hypothetical protein
MLRVRVDVVREQAPPYGDVEIQLPNIAIERFLTGKLLAAFRILSK